MSPPRKPYLHLFEIFDGSIIHLFEFFCKFFSIKIATSVVFPLIFPFPARCYGHGGLRYGAMLRRIRRRALYGKETCSVWKGDVLRMIWRRAP